VLTWIINIRGNSTGISGRSPPTTTLADKEPVNVATDLATKTTRYKELVGNHYYDEMRSRNATRSMDHFRKFTTLREEVVSTFDITRRFHSNLSQTAALIVSDEFAFLHVWKCGGTTIQYAGYNQTYLENPEVQSRQWVAFVRDPIDRFLSAWAECGSRWLQKKHIPRYRRTYGPFSALDWTNSTDYDFRARAFLYELKDRTYPTQERFCHVHGFPQVNTMMNHNGEIYPQLKIVGDLFELADVMKVIGFPTNRIESTGRKAAENPIKAKHYPPKRHLLKRETILELCEYYAIDYFMFDFPPPVICTEKGGPLEKFFGNHSLYLRG